MPRISVDLEIQCTVIHSYPGESYRLVIYGSADGQPHACYNVTTKASQKKESIFKETYHYLDDKRPSSLIISLFATRISKEEDLCVELLIAQSIIDFSDTTTECEAKDTDQLVQANMKVKITTQDKAVRILTKPSENSKRSRLLAFDSAKSQVNDTYNRLTHNEVDINTKLFYVRTPGGEDLSVLDFLANIGPAIYNARVSKLDDSKAERLLLHLFKVTQLTMPTFNIDRADQQNKALFISNMFTQLSRAVIYQKDVIRTGDTSSDIEEYDQWSFVLSFPEFTRASFDCEDGAIMTLQLIYLAQHCQFKDSRLVQIQRELMSYTACFVFGSLCGKNGHLTPHAYAMLVDTRYVDDCAAAKKYQLKPAILLESTAHICGTGNEVDSQCTEADNTTYELVQAIMDEVLYNEKGMNRVVRRVASIPIARDRGVYGPLYALLAPWHKKKTAKHLLFHNGYQKIGCPMMDVFSYKNSKWEVALEFDIEERKQFRFGQYLPRCEIPHISDEQTEHISLQLLKKPLGNFHLSIHAETFERKRKSILNRFKAAQFKTDDFTILTVPITEDLNTVQLWFDYNNRS
jgi:hypothetical protein